MKSMEKSRSEEMAVIFRQLSPINQRYFLMMVQWQMLRKKCRKKELDSNGTWAGESEV